jgi:DNA-binding MarR family transcriptional regulator
MGLRTLKKDGAIKTKDLEAAARISTDMVDNLGFRLRLAQNLVFKDFNERFAELGLTQSLWSVLILIEGNPGLRQADLGAPLGIQQANLVELIETLVNRGLINRVPLPSDRRSQGLHLTAEGVALMVRGWKVHRGHIDYLHTRISSEAEYRLLTDLLQRLIAGPDQSPGA